MRARTGKLFNGVLRRPALLAFCAPAVMLTAQTPPCDRGTFPDYHDQVKGQNPPGASGPTFKLSQNYPDKLPPMGNYPWLKVAVVNGQIQNPATYLEAMRQYTFEGNTTSNDIVNFGDNKIRPWFHVPWMHYEPTGREYMHGLTHEIDNRPKFLDAGQTGIASTWAVSGLNDRGGWAVGQVWCHPQKPDPYMLNPDEEKPNAFPNGTAQVKFLFTTGAVDQIPWLKNSLEWDADLAQLAPLPATQAERDKCQKILTGSGNSPGEAAQYCRSVFEACDGDGNGCRNGESCNIGVCFRRDRKPGKVRLLQVDVAVRDDRTATGWVFGTFAYNAAARGATVFDRLVPIGLMWGNDPGITDLAVKHGAKLKESWINPASDPVNPKGMFSVGNHLGYAGRLAGPADQATSSCMSCHMTAGLRKRDKGSIVPDVVPIVWQAFDPKMKTEEKLNWFINLPAGVTFSYDSYVSLDYQLQMELGLVSFYEDKPTKAGETRHQDYHAGRDVVTRVH